MCDPNPDSDLYKFWSRDVQCYSKFGECDFVNHSCICHDEFTHDLSCMRQRACQSPFAYFPVVYGLQLSFSLLLLPYVYVKYKQSKATARISMRLSIAACTFHVLYCIVLFSTGFIINPINLFLMYSYILFLSATKCIEIYSFVSPLAAAAMKPASTAKNILYIFFGFFRACESVPFLIASTKYADVHDINNDLPWNTCIIVFSLIVGIEAITLGSFIVIYAKKMMEFIESQSSVVNDSGGGNLSKVPKEYLEKVRKMILRTSILLPTLSIILFLTPTLYFVTGFLPGSNYFSSITLSIVPPLVLSSTIYASKMKQRSEGSQTNPSSVISSKAKDQIVPFNPNNTQQQQQQQHRLSKELNSDHQSSTQN